MTFLQKTNQPADQHYFLQEVYRIQVFQSPSVCPGHTPEIRVLQTKTGAYQQRFGNRIRKNPHRNNWRSSSVALIFRESQQKLLVH